MDSLENELATIIVTNEQMPLTQCIRCSAHTLQLCVDNGLKLQANMNILTKVRKVVFIIIFINRILFS